MRNLQRIPLAAAVALALVGGGCSPDDYPAGPVNPGGGLLPPEVTFTYVVPEGAPEVTSVNVPGSFNDWDTGAMAMTDNGDGTWSITVPLEEGDYTYKFFFNGSEWASNMCSDATWGHPGQGGLVDLELAECTDGGDAMITVDADGRVGGGGTLVNTRLFVFTPPEGAPAVTSVSVAGEMNEWDQNAHPMTQQEDGSWQVLIGQAPEGTYQYKYVINGDWPANMCDDATWGGGNGWIDDGADECQDDGFGGANAVRTIVGEPELPSNLFIFTPPEGAAAVTSVSVAGEMNEWDQNAHPMEEQDDGSWQVRIFDVEPGTYQYKYVINGNWPPHMCDDATWGGDDGWIDDHADECQDDGFGGANAVRTLLEGDLAGGGGGGGGGGGEMVEHTFTFVEPAGAPEVTSVHLAGGFQGWDPEATPMTEVSEGTWEVTLEIEAGVHEFKYVINGEWVGDMCNDPTWGDPDNGNRVGVGVEECNGGNAILDTEATGGGELVSHTFTYVVPAGAPSVTSVNVPGSFNGWDNTASPMTETSPGVWEVTLELAEEVHEYKYFFNGDTWAGNMCGDATWGDPDNDNKVDPNVATCNGENAVLDLTGTGGGTPVSHTFVYVESAGGPEVTSVNLAGSFQGWDMAATPFTESATAGTWEVTVELAPGTHEYKYVFNGDQWASDMCNDNTWGDPDNDYKVDPNVQSCAASGGNAILVIE